MLLICSCPNCWVTDFLSRLMSEGTCLGVDVLFPTHVNGLSTAEIMIPVCFNTWASSLSPCYVAAPLSPTEFRSNADASQILSQSHILRLPPSHIYASTYSDTDTGSRVQNFRLKNLSFPDSQSSELRLAQLLRHRHRGGGFSVW